MMAEPPLVAVLAAGLGRRFGGGKLDAMCAGQPLGCWALENVVAAGLPAGVIVTGTKPPDFAVKAADWRLLTNPAPGAGLGSSVALAARHARGAGQGLLLLLADMPLVPPAHLRQLATSGEGATSLYPDGKLGIPVHLPVTKLDPLMTLAGSAGAAPVLSAMSGLRRIILDPDAACDVDTPTDLAQIARLMPAPQ